MNYIEHYFENLLFNGKDPINRYYLTDEEAETVEICAGYVYELFGHMGDLFNFLDSKEVEDDLFCEKHRRMLREYGFTNK